MAKPTWQLQAACAPEHLSDDEKHLDWYSTNSDKKYDARIICESRCPVRKECIQYALQEKIIWGIWGGVDDYEIKRALSVDALGEPTQRDRPPRCPFCHSRKLEIAGQKTREGYRTVCQNEECGLTWHMAVIPTKLKTKK